MVIKSVGKFWQNLSVTYCIYLKVYFHTKPPWQSLSGQILCWCNVYFATKILLLHSLMTATRSQINSVDGKYLNRSPWTVLDICQNLRVLVEQMMRAIWNDDGGLEWMVLKVGRFHQVLEICWLIGRSNVGKVTNSGQHFNSQSDLLWWQCNGAHYDDYGVFWCVLEGVHSLDSVTSGPNESNKSNAARSISPEQEYVFSLTELMQAFHGNKPFNLLDLNRSLLHSALFIWLWCVWWKL